MIPVLARPDTVFAGIVGLGTACICVAIFAAAAPAEPGAASMGPAPGLVTAALIIGITAALTPVLQALRVMATHSARDVSLSLMGVFSLSYLTGVLVGLQAQMAVIWVPNAIGFVTMSTAFAVACRIRWMYRHWEPPQ